VNKLVSMVLIAMVLSTGLSACATPTSGSDVAQGTIVVGSKIDTEGSLLAQIIISMLRSNGLTVNDRSQTGPTQVVRQALLGGEVDIYPEYTGNGAVFFPDADPSVWKDAQKGYQTVSTRDKTANNIVWLSPAPANNTWAIAIPKSLSDQQNLRTLTDLAAYVNKGGNIKLACSEEFVTSPAALPAFSQAYGFVLKSGQLLTLAGGNTAQTEKAAADGTSGVNAAMAYGTDGSLSALSLVVLDDPKGVQPVYEPCPTVRGVIYQKYPNLSGIIDPVFKTLDLTTLQSLNAQIALQGRSAAEVAQKYLVSKGLLKQ
jgi:osmoprotectant transport system substrate-binding protein